MDSEDSILEPSALTITLRSDADSVTACRLCLKARIDFQPIRTAAMRTITERRSTATAIRSKVN
jgi:hypothetical protein